jgi:hypothetical protein
MIEHILRGFSEDERSRLTKVSVLRQQREWSQYDS